jgi:hypothetical protein
LDHQLIQILINEEIARIIAEAACASCGIRAGEDAYRLMRQFPNSGMTAEDMTTAIIAAAANAGVAVDMAQSGPVALPKGSPRTARLRPTD